MPEGWTPYPRARWFLLGAVAGLVLAVALAFLAPAPSPPPLRIGISQPGPCTDIPPPIWLLPEKPGLEL